MDSSYYQAISEEIAAGKIEPRAGHTYTTRQVIAELALADIPSLGIVWNGLTHPVQTSHMSQANLESWCDAGAGDRLWRYERTTHEWIPVFVYVDDALPIDIVDAERWKFEDYEPESKSHNGALWMTPRGFPRKQ